MKVLGVELLAVKVAALFAFLSPHFGLEFKAIHSWLPLDVKIFTFIYYALLLH